FYGDALLALGPWAGFLILTGYVVGTLAEQREARLGDVKNAYLATLELLTYHIESTERNQQGHSNRVADVAVAIGRELDLPEEEVENLRVAALLHEVGTRDQRLLRLLSRSVTDSTVAVARWMRGAAEIIGEYGHYYEIVGEDWDIEALPLPVTVKILAVADGHDRQWRDRQGDGGRGEGSQQGQRRFLSGVDEPQPAPHEVARSHEATAQRGGANQ